MPDVERFTPGEEDGVDYGFSEMHRDPQGEWVRHYDYDNLRAKYEGEIERLKGERDDVGQTLCLIADELDARAEVEVAAPMNAGETPIARTRKEDAAFIRGKLGMPHSLSEAVDQARRYTTARTQEAEAEVKALRQAVKLNEGLAEDRGEALVAARAEVDDTGDRRERSLYPVAESVEVIPEADHLARVEEMWADRADSRSACEAAECLARRERERKDAARSQLSSLRSKVEEEAKEFRERAERTSAFGGSDAREQAVAHALFAEQEKIANRLRAILDETGNGE